MDERSNPRSWGYERDNSQRDRFRGGPSPGKSRSITDRVTLAAGIGGGDLMRRIHATCQPLDPSGAYHACRPGCAGAARTPDGEGSADCPPQPPHVENVSVRHGKAGVPAGPVPDPHRSTRQRRQTPSAGAPSSSVAAPASSPRGAAMFRVSHQGDGIDDADTIDSAREIVRGRPPRPRIDPGIPGRNRGLFRSPRSWGTGSVVDVGRTTPAAGPAVARLEPACLQVLRRSEQDLESMRAIVIESTCSMFDEVWQGKGAIRRRVRGFTFPSS